MLHAATIRVLGPIEICGEAGVRVPGPRAQRLLAALAISEGHAVASDRLVEIVWGEAGPAEPRAALHALVGRLRRLLPPAAIATMGHSYALTLPCDSVDACRFAHLVGAAHRLVATDPTAASRNCEAALALWRGEPFGDLAGEPFLVVEAERLWELHEAAVECGYVAELALGHQAQSVPSMLSSVRERPYREKRWYLLIAGLARNGRRVEALRIARRAARTLGATGLEPSAELRELEQQILDDELDTDLDGQPD